MNRFLGNLIKVLAAFLEKSAFGYLLGASIGVLFFPAAIVPLGISIGCLAGLAGVYKEFKTADIDNLKNIEKLQLKENKEIDENTHKSTNDYKHNHMIKHEAKQDIKPTLDEVVLTSPDLKEMALKLNEKDREKAYNSCFTAIDKFLLADDNNKDKSEIIKARESFADYFSNENYKAVARVAFEEAFKSRTEEIKGMSEKDLSKLKRKIAGVGVLDTQYGEGLDFEKACYN